MHITDINRVRILTFLSATGPTDCHLLLQALDAGHRAPILARSPAELETRDGWLTGLAGHVRDLVPLRGTIGEVGAVISDQISARLRAYQGERRE